MTAAITGWDAVYRRAFLGLSRDEQDVQNQHVLLCNGGTQIQVSDHFAAPRRCCVCGLGDKNTPVFEVFGLGVEAYVHDGQCLAALKDLENI